MTSIWVMVMCGGQLRMLMRSISYLLEVVGIRTEDLSLNMRVFVVILDHGCSLVAYYVGKWY
jgi:hypothetical protein